MLVTNNQCLKAAVAFADALKGVTPSQKDRFRHELQKALLKEGDWNLVGVYENISSFLRGVLTKSKLPESVLTGVIVVSFEAADKIKVFHGGIWRER